MDGQQPRCGPARDVLWVGLDCAAAAALAALSVSTTSARSANFGWPTWCVMAAAVAVTAPLAVRRCWPVSVFAVVLTVNCFLAMAGVARNPGVLVALALYTVAVGQPARRSLPLATLAVLLSVAAGWAGLVAGRQALAWPVRLDVLVGTGALLVAAWALGAARRGQLRYAARTAEQATRRAVADERMRIARELHDVITHSMSLITVKASVANYLIDSRSAEVCDALTVIEDTGRGALAELRRMLGVLRADGAGAQWDPAPDLAGLAGLADHAAVAGVHIDLEVDVGPDLPTACRSPRTGSFRRR